jgi:hypothetical protein
MLYPEQLDRDDIQAISRDGLIMALNRKVDLLAALLGERLFGLLASGFKIPQLCVSGRRSMWIGITDRRSGLFAAS